MNSDRRLLSVVAISGSSILVGCGGYSGSSCGSYGSYGSYGSIGVGAVRRRVRNANGAQSDSGTVAATVTAAGLNGTLTHRSGDVGSLSLAFDDTYNLASSLPTLAGSWSSSVNGFGLTATIASDGTFTAVDSDNCTYDGSFSLMDPNVNAYSESFVRSCNGNTTTFTGLASYFPATASGTPTPIGVIADDNRGDYLVADLQ